MKVQSQLITGDLENEMFLPALADHPLVSDGNDGFALRPRGSLITVRDISYRETWIIAINEIERAAHLAIVEKS